MKGKRRSRITAKRKISTSRSNSRKMEQNDTPENQDTKISTRSSFGTNRTNSLEKETSEKCGISEVEINANVESGTRRNSRNSQMTTTEKNTYSSKTTGSSTIQTRRSASQNMRDSKETTGDSKKMKNYVVTRSVSSKRENMKSNKNVDAEKIFTDVDGNTLSLAAESEHNSNVNTIDAADNAEASPRSRESPSSPPHSHNKDTGKRESKKRERKEVDTYKILAREGEDTIKRQKRQDRKTNNRSEEMYVPNDESNAQLSKEKMDKHVDKGKEMKKEGRVLRGRRETVVTEKEKRGRGHGHGYYGYAQQYYGDTEQRNTSIHTSKDVEEADDNYAKTVKYNDKHKYSANAVAVEKEKGREKRREKHHNTNGMEKTVERGRRSHVKPEGEGFIKKMDKHTTSAHEGRTIREGKEELTTKRGKAVSGIDKKEMATAEVQYKTNKLEGNAKWASEVASTEKGSCSKGKQEGREEKEKAEKNIGKENELENENDDLLKSSYIKNGRVLRNLNRHNVANDNTRTSIPRNTRNEKNEVFLSNIITNRRKRKNAEDTHPADAAEYEKNKHHANANNALTNNATKRKTKKGKRTTRRGAGNTKSVAIKVSTRTTNARNANTTAGKTNAAVSLPHEKRGNNHVTVNTSEATEERQKQRGSGAPNYTNHSGKVNVATVTDPYNQPVSHCTRFRERQTVQLEEPEQKKRKKRVTEEGSKESSKINVGENYQVQTLPTFFLCRPELMYDACDNSDSDGEDQQCFDCAGLPCHCKSGEPKLVYSPLMLERVKERCLKSRGYHKCVKNEMELSAYVQECAKSWKTNTDEWIPFSPEYAYKLLHYANYDPLKAISLMKSRDFSFRKVLDPPTRKYQNKWKPKDKREHLSKSPFPSPLTIRNYLSKRHHNSGYHLR